MKHKKAQVGLQILLSLIVMLFVIGLLVFIFAIMGDSLRTATYDTETFTLTNKTTGTSCGNTTGCYVNTTFTPTNLRSCALTITTATNKSTGMTITTPNYTVSGCLINGSTASVGYSNTSWNITGTVTWLADNTATDTMNNTVAGISGAVDWFDIIIVIASMIILIFLVVLIINAIRGSGMIVGGTGTSPNSVGTA